VLNSSSCQQHGEVTKYNGYKTHAVSERNVIELHGCHSVWLS